MTAHIILEATAGSLRGEKIVFAGRSRCMVGRGSDCTLRLPGNDLNVSRHHCVLEIDAPSVWVMDLGSLNGTFVNGKSVGQRDPGSAPDERGLPRTPRPLVHGDELRVGVNAFTIVIKEPVTGEADLDLDPQPCETGTEPRHLQRSGTYCRAVPDIDLLPGQFF